MDDAAENFVRNFGTYEVVIYFPAVGNISYRLYISPLQTPVVVFQSAALLLD